MRPKFKRFVAALVGAVTLATPGTVLAEDGKYCPTYAQVSSGATGGSYVGGILMYETMATYQYQDPSTATTTSESMSGTVGIPGGGPSAGGTATMATTVTNHGKTVSVEEPVGYYAMNDGSIYRINCITGEATLSKAA